jgi:hypothetical protein
MKPAVSGESMPGKVKALSFAIIEMGPDDAGHFPLLATSGGLRMRRPEVMLKRGENHEQHKPYSIDSREASV